MSKKIWTVVAALAMLVSVTAAPTRAADEDGPKWNTKEIMKAAMKGPLLKKVASGEASDEEKKTLHEMMVALSENAPKRGEQDSWDEKTKALVTAAQAAVDGKAGAAGMLKKASNCKACHTPHK